MTCEVPRVLAELVLCLVACATQGMWACNADDCCPESDYADNMGMCIMTCLLFAVCRPCRCQARLLRCCC